MTALSLPRRRARISGGDAGLGLLMALPIILLMGSLVFWPLVMTFWDSVHRVDPMRFGTPFVGLRNYLSLFSDSDVQSSAFNTIVYVVVAVVIETAGGVAAALLLNSLGRARKWVLAAVILPWALPPVVNSIIWLWIYNPSYGVLNGVLRALGVISQNHVWFNDRWSALLLIAVVHIWRMLPITAVIVLAGLQSIPQELYEAARIDGAGALSRFGRITLPLIGGSLAIAMTQSTVLAFNLFDEAWILNGSSGDTRTLLIQVYMSAFQDLHFSYGMALSVLVMFASLAVSLIYVIRGKAETSAE
ncbi:sugar ABC transporter permease [Acidisoma cellulosilytica]|uniref:Sugar ABC transporter permease n=1 Tax=Acidisoma cellulosilyticum TaxID=2802395 RepID=A0A964E4C0_9PROT|nr:sugar ABC transporter permease [Acidisoma cellulosilyticum]MCB8881535.1 sugar ABC transporter permease [Acidisoma cellulosilyticum]